VLKTENLVHTSQVRMKIALGIIQLWFKYVAAYFPMNWTCTFPERLMREMSP